MDHLKLAVLKRHFHVSVDSENDLVLSAGQETDNNISSGLPVILFFSFDKDSSALGNIQDHGNYFNKEHRFSKWLIENHEKLMTEVPEICRNILNTMIYSQNTDEFAEEINKCLRVLRQLDAEGFRITNGLDIRQEELNPKHSEGKGENK